MSQERDALIEWAKQACNRLARSKNQTDDGRDLRHAEALMPILKAEINRPEADLTSFLHELPNILIPLQARAGKGQPPSEEQMARLWRFNDNLRALAEGREPTERADMGLGYQAEINTRFGSHGGHDTEFEITTRSNTSRVKNLECLGLPELVDFHYSDQSDGFCVLQGDNADLAYACVRYLSCWPNEEVEQIKAVLDAASTQTCTGKCSTRASATR